MRHRAGSSHNLFGIDCWPLLAQHSSGLVSAPRTRIALATIGRGPRGLRVLHKSAAACPSPTGVALCVLLWHCWDAPSSRTLSYIGHAHWRPGLVPTWCALLWRGNRRRVSSCTDVFAKKLHMNVARRSSERRSSSEVSFASSEAPRRTTDPRNSLFGARLQLPCMLRCKWPHRLFAESTAFLSVRVRFSARSPGGHAREHEGRSGGRRSRASCSGAREGSIAIAAIAAQRAAGVADRGSFEIILQIAAGRKYTPSGSRRG